MCNELSEFPCDKKHASQYRALGLLPRDVQGPMSPLLVAQSLPDCTMCRGTGEIGGAGRPCPMCNGTGKLLAPYLRRSGTLCGQDTLR